MKNCYVTISKFTISSLFGNKPKKLDFVHQIISHREACMGWARD